MRSAIRRFLLSLFALWTVCSFSFFLIHIIPGDPVDIILGDQALSLDREALRKSLHLDQNLFKQYTHFLVNLSKGDLSTSIHSNEPVVEELKKAFPATFELAFFSLLLAILWGIPAGFFSVLKKGVLEEAWSFISITAMSLPVFFLAPILIWIFSIQLNWFPVSERGTGLEYLILPALSLALPLGAVLLKMSRASLLEVMTKNYIRTGKAKGLSDFSVGLKHGLKNALIPIVTVLGLQSGALLTGTVIVESIFDWPGLGLLLLSAIQQRDYPLVQGTVLLISVIYVLINLIVDLIYMVVHPKMQSAH